MKFIEKEDFINWVKFGIRSKCPPGKWNAPSQYYDAIESFLSHNKISVQFPAINSIPTSGFPDTYLSLIWDLNVNKLKDRGNHSTSSSAWSTSSQNRNNSSNDHAREMKFSNKPDFIEWVKFGIRSKCPPGKWNAPSQYYDAIESFLSHNKIRVQFPAINSIPTSGFPDTYLSLIWDLNVNKLKDCVNPSTSSSAWSTSSQNRSNNSYNDHTREMKFSNKTDFIDWVKLGIRSKCPPGKWNAPSQYYEAIESFLSHNKIGVQFPAINSIPTSGFPDMYLSLIWDLNVSKLKSSNDSYDSLKSNSDSFKTYTSPKKTNKLVDYLLNGFSKNYHYYSDTSDPSNDNFKFGNKGKKEVEEGYQNLINLLNEIVLNFDKLSIQKPELNKVKEDIVSNLNKALFEIKKEKDYALTQTQWDKLVIGFFGETNAGKSTILESLRILLKEDTRRDSYRRGIKTDGEIVGDGRQDFTQDYHEYNMNIGKHPFMLIDVPGIEGKENLYKGKIGEALRKAHIIFYINGHNKGIDKGTASKIKDYMGDSVKVSVIYNVRGNSDDFEFAEDRVSLLTQSVNHVVKNLESDFKVLIGDKFYQTIPVQGLLALSAFAEFSDKRPDLKRKQNSILQYFKQDVNGDSSKAKEKILNFSNINLVISLIEERSKNFSQEIASANFLKLESFRKRTLIDYRNVVKNQLNLFTNYYNQVSRFIKENNEEVEVYSRSFKQRAESEIGKLINEFSKNAMYHVEKSEFNHILSDFYSLKRNIESKIYSIAKDSSLKIAESVIRRSQKLSNIPGLKTLDNTILAEFKTNMNFSISGIKDADSIKFKDVFSSGVSTVGGAGTGALIGSFFGPIGTLIGGAIGGFAGMVSGNANAGSQQTERAKKAAKEEISKIRDQVQRMIITNSYDFKQQMLTEIKKVNFQATTQLKEIEVFVKYANETDDKLNKIIEYLH